MASTNDKRLCTRDGACNSLVPVIDISALSGADLAARKATALEIGRACGHIGFFIVVNHGVSEDLIKRAWSKTEELFDEPFEDKAALVPPDPATDPYGYSKLGGELLSLGKAAETKGADSIDSAQTAAKGDLKEMFSMGPKNPAAGMAPRRLPQKPHGFAEAWDAYYEEVNKLAARILAAFAIALDLPENWFEDKLDKHCSALRANNYPDQTGMTVPHGAIRASAHTDYGTVTVLRSGGPGLQVCKDVAEQGEEAWQDVPYIEDSFVINLGDLMRRWTNERWCSTLHRVINPPSSSAAAWGRRMAMAYFHNLNKDAVVEAIPSCVSEATPRLYDPIVAGEFLMLKHLASQGKAASDAHLVKRSVN